MTKGFIHLFVFIILFFLLNNSFSQSKLTHEIHGINGDALKNAEAALSEIKYKNYSVKNQEIIKESIKPFGFFRAKVSSRVLKSGSTWKTIYYVIPGKPLKITTINITISGQGINNRHISNYIKQCGLKSGQTFNVLDYDRFKTHLFEIAKNEGYLKANFKNKIYIDLVHYTCNVEIQLETGPQYYFGTVTFMTFPYSKAFMEKFISFHPGEVFSSIKILKLQQRMEKSYYFTRAIFKPEFENKNLSVPVTAFFYPPYAQTYSIGLGYGTLTGPRIAGGISLRHIGNEGHHLEAQLKLSSTLSAVSITYYIPGNNPLTDEWFSGVNYRIFSPKAGISHSLTLSGGYSKNLENWNSNISINVLADKFNIASLPPGHLSHMIYPQWNLSYVCADNVINPHKAFAWNFSIQASKQDVFSSNNSVKIQTRIKAIFSPFREGRILLRTDFGVIDTNHLSVFPLSMRYFAGGITSIRGFSDSSIGPGKYLGTASAEYQHPIKDNWYGAVFYDVGNASNHVSGPLNRGAGVGAIYNTRIGPLKIYVARALSKHTKPYSVEFSIGPEFL